MVEFWQSGAITITTGGNHQDFHLLASFGIGERLRRTIVQANILVLSGTQDVLDTWSDHGVLSLIEVTKGNPPPFPDQIDQGNFLTRDIVYSQQHQLGAGGISTSRHSVPAPPAMIDIDVQISRGDGVDPISVWWVWGLPNFSGAGVEVGFEKLWFRVLGEQI